MGRQKRKRIELRYYEVPRGESVLALLGDGWKRNYGNDIEFMHFHNLWEIGYCYYGMGNMEFADGSLIPYGNETITFIPVNIVHNTRTDTLGRIDYWEYLFLDAEQLLGTMYESNNMKTQAQLQQLGRRPLVLRAAKHPQLAQLIKLIIAEMRQNKERREELTRYCAYSVFIELIRVTAGLEQESGTNRQRISQIKPALEYVEHNFCEQPRVRDLADSCGMSETHFRRLFEDAINMTPVAYVNLVRIQHACTLLGTTDKSIEAIAADVGFVSQATFNRNFTRLMGQPALKWKHTADHSKATHISYNILARAGWNW